MSAALGVLLGTGLLLLASPWLWPAGASRSRQPRRPTIESMLAAGAVTALTPAGFIAVSIGLAFVAALVVFAISGVAVLGLLAGIAAGVLPTGELKRRASVRVKAGRLAWPDVIDHLVGAVRSGIALPDAVAALGEGGPPMFRGAFRAFGDTYSRTGSFAIAADELKDRLADPIADRIIETLRMAREVGGGELAAVLRDLARHLRAEGAIRAEVEARQSGVANTAKLGAAAPWIVLGLLCTRPEAAAAYGTTGGVTLLAGGAIVSVLAYRLMRSIGRLPVEGRWFG